MESRLISFKFWLNRSARELMMAELANFLALIGAGKAKLEGNLAVFEQLRSLLKLTSFEIRPGTRPAKAAIASQKDAFEQPRPADVSGG